MTTANADRIATPGPNAAFRCTRRTAVAAIAGLWRSARCSASAGAEPGAQPTLTGDCLQSAGVDLLGRFDLGEAVVPLEALLTPMDWQFYSHPQTGLTFRYPPDWIAATLQADRFTPAGAPIWTTNPSLAPALTTHRVMSADGSALFEAGIGTIHDAILAPLQAATMAELGIVGDGAALADICAFEDRNPLQPSWLRAAWAGNQGQVTIASQGYALANPGSLTPNTIVTWYAMAGPTGLFEPLMREVFLRILVQFLPGGGDQPTPTPEGW